jgi:hypothetical protein
MGEWFESSVDCMLQALQSPAFASRWVAPSRGVGTATPLLSASDTCTAKRSKPTVETATSTINATSALQLLHTTAIVRAKPPPVLTHVLKQLETADLLRAGAVCRDWRDAAAHDNSWSLIFESEPLLSELHQRYGSKFSRKQLGVQQKKANALASAPFNILPTTDYQCLVEVALQNQRLSQMVPLISAQDPNDVRETLLTTDLSHLSYYFDWDGWDFSDAEVKVYLIRKRDGKRMRIVDTDDHCEVLENSIFFMGQYYVAATCDPDAFRAPCFDVYLEFEENEQETSTKKLESLAVRMVSYSDDLDALAITSVNEVLQMLECPGYAHCWA